MPFTFLHQVEGRARVGYGEDYLPWSEMNPGNRGPMDGAACGCDDSRELFPEGLRVVGAVVQQVFHGFHLSTEYASRVVNKPRFKCLVHPDCPVEDLKGDLLGFGGQSWEFAHAVSLCKGGPIRDVYPIPFPGGIRWPCSNLVGDGCIDSLSVYSAEIGIFSGQVVEDGDWLNLFVHHVGFGPFDAGV